MKGNAFRCGVEQPVQWVLCQGLMLHHGQAERQQRQVSPYESLFILSSHTHVSDDTRPLTRPRTGHAQEESQSIPACQRSLHPLEGIRSHGQNMHDLRTTSCFRQP